MRGSETGNGYRLRSTTVQRSKRTVFVFLSTIKISTGSYLREEVGRIRNTSIRSSKSRLAIQNHRFVVFKN